MGTHNMENEEKLNWLGNKDLINILDNEVSKIDTKEKLKKLYNEIKNEKIDSFDRFKKYFLIEYLGMKNKTGAFWEDLMFHKKAAEGINMDTLSFLRKSDCLSAKCIKLLAFGKVFNIDEKLQNIFTSTKNKIYKRDLPFKSRIFIPCNLNLDDGLLNVFTIILTPIEDLNEFIITIFGHDKKDGEMFYHVMYELNDTKHDMKQKDEVWGCKKQRQKDQLIIKNYICNFLDFLNHPEIETKIIKHNNNEKRIERFQLPIPDKVFITVRGKMYKYIYEDLPEILNKSYIRNSCRFWVRGHFMHFRNKKRYKKLYSNEEDKLKERGYYSNNDIISKFIPQYMKGSGEMQNKIYKLRK